MSKVALILLERPSRLTESQLDKLSDIFIGVGILFFGSLVIPSFIPGIDKPLLRTLLLGLGASFGSWMLAILIARRIEL